MRLIAENLLLCLLQSTLISTAKYLAGTLSLRCCKILTERVHRDYFQVRAVSAVSPHLRTGAPACTVQSAVVCELSTAV